MSGTITHSWNGTILTVTSDSGTSSADLKGEKGDTGIRGAQGAEGKLDTSFVYTKATPPTAEEVGAHPNTWLPTPTEIGAAPGGYGLGTASSNIAQDLNTVVDNGWYSYNKNACSNTPENSASMLLVENFYNTNYCKQTVTTIFGITYIRIRNGGTWYPWRCVNPPMALGVEYRTMEEWQGKSVYTMLVDCGNLPNKSQKVVTFTSVSTKVLRCCGQVSDGGSFPSLVLANRIDVMGHLNRVYINTNYDPSAYTCTVQVWYLKD